MNIEKSVFEIIRKCIAIGEAVICADDHEVTAPVVFTIEDEAYIYAYCPDFGIFAYGNDLESAKDNLASAISLNFNILHRDKRVGDLYANPLDNDIKAAYDFYKNKHNENMLFLIGERIYHPENTDLIPAIKKLPQQYEIQNYIKLKISTERVEQIRSIA